MSIHKLHPRLQDLVKDQKWDRLTEIQEKAFDPIYQGKSCIIEAPTSGGKTEAVLFPLLTRIATRKTSGFKVLYIAPLKALLNDLALRVLPYAQKCYMEAFKWHGDVSQGDKVRQMNFPSDILLTTPESIEAILLRRGNWRAVFSSLETIVIDEAHYFALTERGSHLMSLLARIGEYLPHEPQRIAVTATIGNPDELLHWLMGGRSGGECIRVEGKNTKEKDFEIRFFVEDGRDLQRDLYNLLVRKKSIVFDRSRTGTEDTAARINQYNQEHPGRFPVKVKTHHSSVSKRLREDAEASIKNVSGESLNAIISTSTLELGIDIGELDQILQIGGLNSSGSFLQRVGRTGRRAGRPQFFRGLCSDVGELVLLTGCVSLGMKGRSEAILLPRRAFHILAHQVICYCIQHAGATAEQIWTTLSKAFCFSKISRAELDMLVAHMVQEEYLRRVNGNVLLTGDKSEKEFLRANYRRLFAIFDTGPIYNVVDGKKVIGTLDSEFARTQQLPFIFVLGGQEWNTLKIDHEQQQVMVQKNETGIAPKWNTYNNPDIPFELAQEVGRLLMGDETIEFLDYQAFMVIRAQREAHRYLGWEKRKWIMEVAGGSGKIHLWTFAGDKINRALHIIFKSCSEGEGSYDYQKVVLNMNQMSIEAAYALMMRLRDQTENDIVNLLESNTAPKWFSKFSACLPDALATRTIIEKGMDAAGLVRELNIVTIEY
ncbi:DEAD/DEAH box helicase [Chitinophaga filiformis]|uniref:DEAD/DEAH box helicase n=1 Tax=Chitinophaga filiformis TaxID=104663 RepID=A0ABY4I923_CHIFI|nr:DEAD/DEAH box helicase [Chitinophaga filiformis]UPK71191.1 DEAD/DEAH box helicase [Chitinophaga filiformis]